jgi:LruC domain-containing protein
LTGIEGFVALKVLNCNYNQLSSLDFSKNTALENLYVIYNQLTNIDISLNTALKEIACSSNLLTSINVTNNVSLTHLDCQGNQLSSLDVTNNPDLIWLTCGENQLTSLDVSNNPNLYHLRCQSNLLTNLDLTNNPTVIFFSCNNNQLTNLNIKYGSNGIYWDFNVTNNPNLSCIQVDDPAWWEANWTNIDPQMYFSENCAGGAFTLIPDPNFEQALIDLGLDDVMDGKVLTASVDTVTTLNVSQKAITNLTGIEDFVALKILNCIDNQLTSLDVSKNLALFKLWCGNNQITSLDVTNNTLLWQLTCQHNQLTSISCSNMPNLEHIEVSLNQLVSLDLSNNVLLQEVGCVHNNLTTLVVDNCASLKTIHCYDNKITSLDVSSCPSLIYLGCYNNQLTNIDVSHNLSLTSLGCFNNKLTHLDVSKNLYLNQLGCNNNLLESLNVRNGNNINFTYYAASSNPNLTCIQVDDPAWSEANWTYIDSQMYFSVNCGASGDDSDGDGVPDDFDDYPMDPLRAFNNYFPAAGYGSLAFEDLWPGMGDYDFNDVVVDYRFKTVTNATNKVVEVYAQFVLKASGASLENGFGFNLPQACQNLISQLGDVEVTGSEIHSNYINLVGNGFEANQTKPTVIVFDNFFKVMDHPGIGLGINTEADKPFVTFDTVNLLIKPTGAIFTMLDFQFEHWNPFIIVNGERGKEVHLPNHPPTDLADLSIFGTYEDSSNPTTGRYYKTANNLPWAINIVSEFAWPLEKVNIVEAYKHFFDWAISSGAEYGDWYEDKAGYREREKIYAVPED